MKLTVPIVSFATAAGAFALAAASNTPEILVFSFLFGGVGIGTLFPALKDRWTSQASLPTSTGLAELEARLRVAEDELASTTRELAMLREKHEFDRQLLAKE